jgi:predicted tellurium resistance membrane protein TerC
MRRSQAAGGRASRRRRAFGTTRLRASKRQYQRVAITTDPFIVYTSNIFAVLGLRALYFALAAMVHRFHYLKYALSVLLVFIGSKIFVADFVFPETSKFPPALSLGIPFAILAAGIAWSLWKTRGDKDGGAKPRPVAAE